MVPVSLEIDESSFGQFYLNAYKRDAPCYFLRNDLMTTLVYGYSIPMRHRIVKSRFELEAKELQASAFPTSYREAMMLVVERYEQLGRAKSATTHPSGLMLFSGFSGRLLSFPAKI